MGVCFMRLRQTLCQKLANLHLICSFCTMDNRERCPIVFLRNALIVLFKIINDHYCVEELLVSYVLGRRLIVFGITSKCGIFRGYLRLCVLQ